MSSTILIFLFLLFVKHTLVDLAIQHLFPSNKENYFNPNAHTHYFQHGALTFLIAIFFTSMPFAFMLGFLDYIVHWHVDYTKTKIRISFKLTNKDEAFWFLQALDQSLHYATYFALAIILTSL